MVDAIAPGRGMVDGSSQPFSSVSAFSCYLFWRKFFLVVFFSLFTCRMSHFMSHAAFHSRKIPITCSAADINILYIQMSQFQTSSQKRLKASLRHGLDGAQHGSLLQQPPAGLQPTPARLRGAAGPVVPHEPSSHGPDLPDRRRVLRPPRRYPAT